MGPAFFVFAGYRCSDHHSEKAGACARCVALA